jgi:hypothetical protein
LEVEPSKQIVAKSVVVQPSTKINHYLLPHSSGAKFKIANKKGFAC